LKQAAKQEHAMHTLNPLALHAFDTGALFVVLTLVGVEFSVSAFTNPAASRLEPAAQLAMLSRFALVLGKVMPVWYPLCAVLLFAETFLHGSPAQRLLLLGADLLWTLASVASIFLLVPLNDRIARGAPGWQAAHRLWDRRHRVRIAVLAVAGLLFAAALVR
jgi:uncharacterized membrane protein